MPTMHPAKMFLAVENPTIGFDDNCDMVQIRFMVKIDMHGESLLHIRGKENVRKALLSIKARCSEDLKYAYACVTVEQGLVELCEVPLMIHTQYEVYQAFREANLL